MDCLTSSQTLTRNLSWTGEMVFEGEKEGSNVRYYLFFSIKLLNNNITSKVPSWLAAISKQLTYTHTNIATFQGYYRQIH